MGYETTLIFVKTYGKNAGYYNIIATVELGKVAYHDFRELIQRKEQENQKFLAKHKRIQQLLEKYEKLIEKEMFERLTEKEEDELSVVDYKLQEHLPYIYYRGERANFEDDYGDLLMVANLEEVKDAIIKTQAKWLVDGDKETYQNFDLALAVIDNLMINEKKWGPIKVILWGG